MTIATERLERATVLVAVVETVKALLGAAADGIHENTALVDLSGFDSLFIAKLLEQLEDRLGIEISPALMVPDTFATPGSLADAMLESYES